MLTSHGITPLATYRGQVGRQRIENSLAGLGRPFESLRLDLAADQPFAGLDCILEGGVDYLIDFAQEELEGLVAAADPGAVHRFLETSISARYDLVFRVVRKMVAARSGRLVYISSTASQRPNAGQGFYAAAKQASEALYRSVGLELAGRGITAVTLRPGYVNGGRGRKFLHAGGQALVQKIPLGRALEVKEVAQTILFLLSDGAVGINATAVTMDGGLTAGK